MTLCLTQHFYPCSTPDPWDFFTQRLSTPVVHWVWQSHGENSGPDAELEITDPRTHSLWLVEARVCSHSHATKTPSPFTSLHMKAGTSSIPFQNIKSPSFLQLAEGGDEQPFTRAASPSHTPPLASLCRSSCCISQPFLLHLPTLPGASANPSCISVRNPLKFL